MAKDPAFLFYPGDWMLGTMTMTRHEKGCYMDLLMAQFNSGPLTLNQISNLLGADKGIWATLSSKFNQTEAGLWFNERLELEKEKRKSYTDSRSKNRKKTYDNLYENTYVNHMNKHMENINEDEIEIENKNLKGAQILKTNIVEDLISVKVVGSELTGIDHMRFQIAYKNAGLAEIKSEVALWKTFCAKVSSEDKFFDRQQIWGRFHNFCTWTLKYQGKTEESKRDKLMKSIVQ
jgi:uncharacterized protein YdaU (DUF1376 family)